MLFLSNNNGFKSISLPVDAGQLRVQKRDGSYGPVRENPVSADIPSSF